MLGLLVLSPLKNVFLPSSAVLPSKSSDKKICQVSQRFTQQLCPTIQKICNSTYIDQSLKENHFWLFLLKTTKCNNKREIWVHYHNIFFNILLLAQKEKRKLNNSEPKTRNESKNQDGNETSMIELCLDKNVI